MLHDERYAYPALLLKKLVSGSTLHYHVIYDIACKFEGHIKRNMPELGGFDMALPVFHAYGHKLHCQLFIREVFKQLLMYSLQVGHGWKTEDEALPVNWMDLNPAPDCTTGGWSTAPTPAKRD
ncbi:uncharacterized protein [Apostichopus japonicus]|uniref:uncharacterized protein n=1 Tax=Stichopus japonicus TaxID=307972 RepID=UPI003AB43DD2